MLHECHTLAFAFSGAQSDGPFRDLVWTVANTPDGNADFDIQVQQSLAALDVQLQDAGSDRHHILSLQVILSHIEKRDRFEEHWQRWIGIDPRHWPQRACFQSGLAPGLQIELIALATCSRAEQTLGKAATNGE